MARSKSGSSPILEVASASFFDFVGLLDLDFPLKTDLSLGEEALDLDFDLLLFSDLADLSLSFDLSFDFDDLGDFDDFLSLSLSFDFDFGEEAFDLLD